MVWHLELWNSLGMTHPVLEKEAAPEKPFRAVLLSYIWYACVGIMPLSCVKGDTLVIPDFGLFQFWMAMLCVCCWCWWPLLFKHCRECYSDLKKGSLLACLPCLRCLFSLSLFFSSLWRCVPRWSHPELGTIRWLHDLLRWRSADDSQAYI